MPSAFYVYYRVDAAQLEAAQTQVQALLRHVQQTLGVQGRLQCKHAEPLLWMEVYEPVADASAFAAALETAAAALGFSALLQPGSQRRTERFEPCV